MAAKLCDRRGGGWGRHLDLRHFERVSGSDEFGTSTMFRPRHLPARLRGGPRGLRRDCAATPPPAERSPSCSTLMPPSPRPESALIPPGLAQASRHVLGDEAQQCPRSGTHPTRQQEHEGAEREQGQRQDGLPRAPAPSPGVADGGAGVDQARDQNRRRVDDERHRGEAPGTVRARDRPPRSRTRRLRPASRSAGARSAARRGCEPEAMSCAGHRAPRSVRFDPQASVKTPTPEREQDSGQAPPRPAPARRRRSRDDEDGDARRTHRHLDRHGEAGVVARAPRAAVRAAAAATDPGGAVGCRAGACA